MEPGKPHPSSKVSSVERSGEDAVARWDEEEAGGEVLDSASFLIQGLVHDLNNHVTIIAHSVDLAMMIDEVAHYRVMCGLVAKVCERERVALGQVGKLVRGRDGSARSVDLFELTREMGRRVRAWLPDADFLHVSIPVGEQAGAWVVGNTQEIQELFLYFSGVLAPLESTPGKRPGLAMRMEAMEDDGRGGEGDWAWVFDTTGCAAPPLFWRFLVEHQNTQYEGSTPFPVQRALRLISKHAARLEMAAGTSTLRLIWPRGNAAAGLVEKVVVRGTAKEKEKEKAKALEVANTRLAGKKIAVLCGSLAKLELWRGALQSRGAVVSVFVVGADFLRWLPAGPPPDMVLIDEALVNGSGEFWAKDLAEFPSMRVAISVETGEAEAGKYARYGWVQVSSEKGMAEWLLAVVQAFAA